MEGDLCSLKWQDRMDHLQSVYLEFFQKELCCDVTLVNGKDRFKAHLLVLCACSSYFKDILTSLTPGQHPVIFFNGNTSQEVKWLLDYVYMGEVEIPVDSIEQFLNFGESLGVKGLIANESESLINSSEKIASPSFIELDRSSLTPDLTTTTPNKRNQENFQANGVKRPKIHEGPDKEAPDLLSPIITSHIIIAPNKEGQKSENVKKTKINQCLENELSKLQTSLTQEEFYTTHNSQEFESINFFDNSNILNSPPRSSSIIFDIENNEEERTVITQNETQQSVIFQENTEKEIVEISDDESQIEHILDKSAIVNENQDESLNTPCINPVDSQSQMESDDSEIIIRRTVRFRMPSENNSSEPNVDMNKELRVVLNRCCKDPCCKEVL